ncbi:hypothetical protein [Roseovarius bejariae]|nr:hypothetical protein [Roseovarius bejariae]
MRQALIIGLVLVLAGCGGGDRFRGGQVPRGTPMAFGPISKACMASDRKARSRQLCGCIQAAADQTLTGSQQRRAVTFYRDPHSAQEIRQSDRGGNERFWKAYSDYGERARQLCG